MFSFKKKDSNQSLENTNNSFISKRVDGLKSVALLSAIMLTMLSGCVSDKEYEEVKMRNEELSAQIREYQNGCSALYREYDAAVQEYQNASYAQDEQLGEDMKNFIEEYNSYCQETSFNFEDYDQYICNGYKVEINNSIARFEKFLNHNMSTINYLELAGELDYAQETFGKLKGYVRAINTEKNAKDNIQEEYEPGLE